MKSLNQYIKEKLIVNKDYKDASISPKSFDELRKIIKDRYDKLGEGTKENPIDFNDIDVINIDSFFDENKGGIFQKINFKYIDISVWDVSNVTDMRHMFYYCEKLKSVGDISDWNVSNVTDMSGMFYNCEKLKSVGDLSEWDVSNVTDMSFMFYDCKELESVGDISEWDVSSVKDMTLMFCSVANFNQDISGWNVSSVKTMQGMFNHCEKFNQDISSWNVSNVKDMSVMFYWSKSFNQDLSGWNVSNVIFKDRIFDNCPIKEEYKPKFK